MGISQPLGGLTNPVRSESEAPRVMSNRKRGLGPIMGLLLLASLIGNAYVVGLLRHTPNSFAQLRDGGTAAYPGTVTKLSDKTITIKGTDADGKETTKSITLASDTPFAIFPKNYQTLIPVGLPSSKDDAVVGTTEASVSAQLPYLSAPKALRVNLVREDLLTGKVIEVKDGTVKFTAYAAEGYKEQTLKFAASATYQKLGADGTITVVAQADVKPGMGLYAYLDKAAGPDDAVIQRAVVADFTTTQ